MSKNYIKKTVRYYEGIDEEYLKKRGVMQPNATLLQKLKKHLPGKRILEIGFGLGPDIPWFIENGYTYTGVEPSQTFCRLVRDKYPTLDIINGDITQTDFLPITFDGIWASASLLHLNDQDFKAIMRKCHNWLVDDGILFISLKEGDCEIVDERGRFFNFFTREKLEKFTKDYFVVVDFAYELAQSYNRTPANWLIFYLKKK